MNNDLRCPWCGSGLQIEMNWDSPESIDCQNFACGASWTTDGRCLQKSLLRD